MLIPPSCMLLLCTIVLFSNSQTLLKWQTDCVTKHNILKISAMFFDPLGIVYPIELYTKVLLQETCKQKLSWDAVIPIDINNKKKLFNNKLFKLNK